MFRALLMGCLCVNNQYLPFSRYCLTCFFSVPVQLQAFTHTGLLKVERFDNCSLCLLKKQETPEHSGVNRCLLVVSLAEDADEPRRKTVSDINK